MNLKPRVAPSLLNLQILQIISYFGLVSFGLQGGEFQSQKPLLMMLYHDILLEASACNQSVNQSVGHHCGAVVVSSCPVARRSDVRLAQDFNVMWMDEGVKTKQVGINLT